MNFGCEILDYGAATQRKLKAGTRVCSLPALLTSDGPQGIGYSNDNVGGYAERMLLSEALLLEVPNGLAAEHAALTEPLAVGIPCRRKADVRGDEVPAGDRLRPGGISCHRGAEVKGLHPIVAADLFAGAPRIGAEAGADIVVDPARTQPYATWAEHAAMSPEQKAARPPLQAWRPALKSALIFECVGIPGLPATGVRRRAARMRALWWLASAWKPTLRADARNHEGTQQFNMCWATRPMNSRMPCA